MSVHGRRRTGANTSDASVARPEERRIPPPIRIAASLREALAPVPLTAAEQRLHAGRQGARLLPLFRFITLVGAATYLGFAGWDYLLGGWEGLMAALPLRLAFTLAILMIWLASRHPRVVPLWPYVWSLLIVVVTLGTSFAISMAPGGFEKGPAGLLYAAAANVLVAPVLWLALLNYLLITVIGLGAYAWLGASSAALGNAAYLVVTFVLLFSLVSYWTDQTRRRNLLLELALAEEQARRDALLEAMLPAPIARRLQAGETPIADSVPRASVVFIDVVGYSRLTRELHPKALVDLLEQAFAALDFLASQHRLTKIKTIGDAYVAAAGVVDATDAGPAESVAFALAARDALRALGTRLGRDLDVHAGIATGPVTAGVIGEHRPQFDLWGQTVNNASRLQAAAPPGAIQLDGPTAAAIAGRHTLEHHGPTVYRGIGEIDVWRLVG
jgi:class 3 adenylate cyclase